MLVKIYVMKLFYSPCPLFPLENKQKELFTFIAKNLLNNQLATKVGGEENVFFLVCIMNVEKLHHGSWKLMSCEFDLYHDCLGKYLVDREKLHKPVNFSA